MTAKDSITTNIGFSKIVGSIMHQFSTAVKPLILCPLKEYTCF